MKPVTSLLLGAAIGLVLAATVYYLFTFILPYGYGVVSGITLVGLGLSVGGYVVIWRGERSLITYFLTGLGIGIIIVAFVGAGSGVSPYIGS
ncbi:MAG: hypothetical protein KGI38_04350 [Thaumarchaeota archaeon]|nr:hypothetical protein [Nitrososphaerota archaeon]